MYKNKSTTVRRKSTVGSDKIGMIEEEMCRLCKKFCSGIDTCPKDGFCTYMKEIEKNIIKIIITSHDETD